MSDDPSLLEERTRLSRSLLWTLQRNFFEQAGPEAWRQGVVPHYVTSNPYIARAFGQVVFGFLRDCARAPAGSGLAIDPGEPIYIVELGSGPGRFAHHFLRRFVPLLQRSVLAGARVKYVMTDVTESNVDPWRAQPSFAPLVDAGLLDFARFDAETDDSIRLMVSGEVLRPRRVKNPIVLIANYVFDGIKQDLFFIRDGRLCEGLVTLRSTDVSVDRSDPRLIERVKATFHAEPAAANYYPDPIWNELLAGYAARLPDTSLLFPTAALECMRRVGELSSGRMLVLSSDKGSAREEALLDRAEPDVTTHGSFSLMVNYHAIAEDLRRRGGLALQTSRAESSLCVCALLQGPAGGDPDRDFVETRQAFDVAIEALGPDDFYALKKAVEKHYDDFDLPQLLALVRLSGHDANIFTACLTAVINKSDGLSEITRREVFHTVLEVWRTYLPLGEERDLAFSLGSLLYKLEYFSEALELYEHSIRIYGRDARALYNMGLARFRLRQVDEALILIDEALTVDPTLEPARATRIRIQAEQSNR